MKLSVFTLLALCSCSSIKFSKSNLIYGTLVGSAVGTGVGLMTAKRNLGSAAAIGAVSGGLVGALTITTISREEAISFDFLKDLKKNSKKTGSSDSFPIAPKDFPKDVRRFLKAPRVHTGKTGWTELDGELHEPHRYFYYEEGGLSAN